MGDHAGAPCGPCTEIFYDMGDVPKGDDRFLEVWNLVFMQYQRDEHIDSAFTPLNEGKMSALWSSCVDTGMGLERIAAVMQGVHSNYDTDAFSRLIVGLQDDFERLSGRRPNYQRDSYDKESVALRVIADHIRAASFLITDGVTPEASGRGYVLRRILRRAVRSGFLLGIDEPFLAPCAAKVLEEYGEVFPELQTARPIIDSLLGTEEALFLRTLRKGNDILSEELQVGDCSLSYRFVCVAVDSNGWAGYVLDVLLCCRFV